MRLEMGLLQQGIVFQLELIKIESAERSLKGEHVNALSKTFKLSAENLLSLWVATSNSLS